jgi:hypothetical protein
MLRRSSSTRAPDPAAAAADDDEHEVQLLRWRLQSVDHLGEPAVDERRG